MDRNEAIKRIRAGLKRRSSRPWSVTGGRGTSWGWITIGIPPRLRNGNDEARRAAGASLAETLGMDRVHLPESIPASTAYYVEYVDRAEGRTPSRTGTPYWD